MRAKHFVYALADPRTSEIRYVGRSSRGLARPRMHSCASVLRKDPNLHKRRWVEGILRAGMEPRITILEVVDDPERLPDRERYYIALFRTAGARLVNLTDGGEGTVGYRHTKQARRAMSLKKGGFAATHGNQAVSMYRQGWSSPHVADHFGVATPTVVHLLRARGVQVREPFKLSNRDVRAVKNDYERGVSLRRIAASCRCSVPTIRDALLRAGVVLRAQRVDLARSLSTSQIQAIADAYERGRPYYELADEHGMSRTAMRALLTRAGVRLRTLSEACGGRPFSDQHGRVYHTQAEAARATGAPQTSVGDVLSGKLRQTHGFVFRYLIVRA